MLTHGVDVPDTSSVLGAAILDELTEGLNAGDSRKMDNEQNGDLVTCA